MPFLCKLLGHKWRTISDLIDEGSMTGGISKGMDLRPWCVRCGVKVDKTKNSRA